ncbi:MAG: AI-2E family transporter, partial [Vicinamibacterales bacterium]
MGGRPGDGVSAVPPAPGAFLVWAPAAIFLAITGAWIRALILVAWGVLVVGTIDNLLSPRLVGHRTRMHELLVFFSVLGGLETFGVLGVVLGPVAVAVTLALIEMVRRIEPAARRDAARGFAHRDAGGGSPGGLIRAAGGRPVMAETGKLLAGAAGPAGEPLVLGPDLSFWDQICHGNRQFWVCKKDRPCRNARGGKSREAVDCSYDRRDAGRSLIRHRVRRQRRRHRRRGRRSGA